MKKLDFDDVVSFHGHACPGLAMGFRLSLLAIKELDLQRSGDEEIVAVVENSSCAVDAVQCITGCTFGKGNLIVRDYGKQVYTFMKRPGGEALRIAVFWKPAEEKEEDGRYWKQYLAGDRSPEVVRAVQALKDAKLKAILAADDQALFKVQKMSARLPERARVYPTIDCARCGERVMEPKAVAIGSSLFCIPCAEKEKG